MTDSPLGAAVLSSVVVSKGRVLRAFGSEVTFFLDGAQTGGKLTVFSEVTPPGGGPPPHYHDHEDEWFFPLEGRVEFFFEGAWKEVALGTAIFAPRGAVHTFRNPGDQPLKMLFQTSPSGFEIFFEKCAAEFAKPGVPDMDRIVEIGVQHGIHFVAG